MTPRRTRPPRIVSVPWYFLGLLAWLGPTLPALGGVAVPRTGQTTCYESYAPDGSTGQPVACDGTGQDGELQAGARWPEPRFTRVYCDDAGPCASQGADCDAEPGNDVVRDHLTGLMWPANGARLPSSDWMTALSAAEALVLCGQSDWHLPNLRQLASVLNAGVTDGRAWLEARGFSNLAFGYWTSTTAVARNFTYRAWFVELDDGTTDTTNKQDIMPVWPVRIFDGTVATRPLSTGQDDCYDGVGVLIPCAGTGQDGELRLGEPLSVTRFSDMGDGTVLDTATGLRWLQDATCLWTNYPAAFPTTRVGWLGALEAVRALNAGSYPLCAAGQSDWRLPNRNELGTLASFDTSNPALSPGHPFLNVTTAPFNFWSSTSGGYTPEAPAMRYAHYLHLYDGMLDSTLKHDFQWVWPVRGGSLEPVGDGGTGDAGVADGGTQDGGVLPPDGGQGADAGTEPGGGHGCSCVAGPQVDGALLALLLVVIRSLRRCCASPARPG